MTLRRKELGALVRNERVRRGMRSQPALAKRAGISARRVSDVERGEYAGAKTFDAIESALDWPKRSMQAYLDGGPEPTATAPEEPRHEWSASERARMRDMSMAEVQETHDIFRRRSEYLADVWLREVMRVKAEAETKMDSQPNTER